MAHTAYLPIIADRYGAVVRHIFVVGLDLTGVDMRAQVRLYGDVPGTPLVDLTTVSNGNAQGLRLVEVTHDGIGVPTSHVELVINETTMEALPYAGEIGDVTTLAWDWQLTIAGRKRRLAKGEFQITGDGVTGAEAAPTNRIQPYGLPQRPVADVWSTARMTFGEEQVTVQIDGADLVAPLAKKASDAAARAENAEDQAEQNAAAASLAASGAIAAMGNLYPTVAAGLAATPADGFFAVVGDGAATYAILYRKVSGAAAEQARYASKAAYEGPAGAALIGFQGVGTGAKTRTVRDKLGERVSVFDFGAVGDGVTDDTAAIQKAIAAIRPGATLYFGDGYSFWVSQTLIFTKPIRLFGSAKENTKLIFDPNGSYTDVGNGTLAGMWWLHSTTEAAVEGDARRSVMSGIDLVNNSRPPTALTGIVASVPVYFYEVDVFNFGRDGFAVWAAQAGDPDAQSGLPIGNANGCTFTNCTAIANGRDGFSFLGDNANRCGILNCSAPNNGRNGFRDNSLLGCAFINCEGDNNSSASYWSSKTKPNAASFFCCYSETSPHFDLGPLAQIWGAQGLFKPARSAGGVVQRGLPSGAAYISQPVRIAETDDVAEALGGPSAPGKAIECGENGLAWRVRPGEDLLRLTGDYDTNHVTLAYNGSFCMRLPKGSMTGNIRAGRPWFENGVSFGAAGKSAIVGAGATTPTGGNHQPGALWLNDAPSPGAPVGWVVSTAGEWRPFGLWRA